MSQGPTSKLYGNPPAASEVAEPSDAERRYRNRKALELLRRWSAEEDGYDDEIYPLLEKELQDHRLVIG